MPVKPDQETIDAHKAKLDGRSILEVVINENPVLRAEAITAGVVEEVEVEDE